MEVPVAERIGPAAMVIRRPMVAGSEYYCSSNVKLSKHFSTNSGAHRFFCLGMVAVMATLSGCGVKGDVFTFNGFSGLSDVYTVEQDIQVWTYNVVNYSITLTPDLYTTNVAGRFLYPTPVQMKDPGSTTVKDFSTSFIFQILNTRSFGSVGPGLAFIMVPDNRTIGATSDYMGLLTANTKSLTKNFDSDNHTFGVELDTHLNPEFNDPNNNHICIDVASMNSTAFNTFVPTILLTTSNPERFQQVWIDYFAAESRINIYHAPYPASKPASPLGSQVGVDLSILKEHMYIGFSAAVGYASDNLHTILAWSFSNEAGTLAPEIKIRKDAGPPAPARPPPAPTPPAPPPSGPVYAPASPPLSPFPPPTIVSPAPGSAPKLTPPPGAPDSPSPSASPPDPIPPPSGPTSTPPANSPEPPGPPVKVIVGMSVAGFLIIITGILVFCYCRKIGSKLHIFISHTGGEDGSRKNFPISLYHELKKDPRYEVFIDRYELRKGTLFPEEIKQEFRKIDVGKGVGIMVLTKDYFKKRWPMLELVKFVDMHTKNGNSKVRILPLFYELSPEGIKTLLEAGQVLEEEWAKFSTERHDVDVGKYRDAVRTLGNLNGVEYSYRDWSHDAEYIKVILEVVSKIHGEMHTKS